MAAEFARFKIFLTLLALAADGYFSRGRGRRIDSKIFDIFFGGIQILDFEAEVIQARHESAVRHHVPRTQGYRDFAVGDVIAAVARQPFYGTQLEDLLIVFCNVCRTGAAYGYVVDPPRLIPALLEIAFANVGH